MEIDPIVVQVKPPKTPFKFPKLPSFGNKSTKIIIGAATGVILVSIAIFVTFTVLTNSEEYRKSHNIVTATDEIKQSSGTTLSKDTLPGSGETKGTSVTSSPDAPEVTLTADRSSVLKGGKIKLTWSVTKNPSSCVASQDWTGDKQASGSSEVILSEFRPYMFILTCKKGNSTGYSRIPVGVSEPVVTTAPAKQGTPVVTIAVDRAFSTIGQSAMISWSATNNPTSCTASGDWSGTKAGSGSISTGNFSAAKTYSFTIFCSNSSGAGSSVSTKITVTEPPTDIPVITISTNPADRVVPGATVRISWSVMNNPTSCTASGDWSGTKAANGSETTSALNSVKTYFYNLRCVNSAGAVIETASVDVIPEPPAVALTVSPTSIFTGSSATINWSATNNPTCTASGDWSGTKAANGSASTGTLNVAKTYRYSITCTNAGGTGYVNNIPLVVSNQPAPVVSLSANPISITSGGSSTLSWSATNNPTSCTASGDWSGTRTSSGSLSTGTLSTVKTYSYTLSCSNSGGTSASTTTVSVSSGTATVSMPVVTLSASPTTIGSGSSSTLSWSATNNPTSCTASGSWSGAKAGSGSTSSGVLNTAGTYTYTLACSNSAGTNTKTVTITVIAIPVVTITVTSASINTGSSSTISWSVTNSPSSCTAGGSWSGTKAASGTQSTGAMNTAGSYAYSISCTNAGGTGSNSTTLTVSNAAVVYCAGLTPCYGPSTLATHATTSNCWGYQTAGTTSVLYNLTGFAPNHSGNSSTILTTATCGHAISWSGAPSNSKHTSAKNNTQSTLNAYKVGYYDATKP